MSKHVLHRVTTVFCDLWMIQFKIGRECTNIFVHQLHSLCSSQSHCLHVVATICAAAPHGTGHKNLEYLQYFKSVITTAVPYVSFTPPRRFCRLHMKCDGTRAETRFCLSAKRTSPFKSAGASVQSTTGSRGVRISGNNVGYTMFRGSEGYWLPTPFASFPFTSPPVRHRVPSRFNWTLQHACPNSSSKATCCPRHSVMLLEEIFVMRKGLLTLPVALPRQNAEAILITHALFICADKHYVDYYFVKKKSCKMATL